MGKAYFSYFGSKTVDQGKNWTPHVSCISCNVTLVQWMKDKRRFMSLAVPMVWCEPTNRFDDCYFSLKNTEGY